MSNHSINVYQIDKIEEHPNADALKLLNFLSKIQILSSMGKFMAPYRSSSTV